MTTPAPGRRTAMMALLLAVATNARVPLALGHEAAQVEAAPGKRRSGPPTLPISLIEGSQDAWSMSRTEAGCYLLSPHRKGSSRLAIGRSPTFGLGLFAVHFALAMPGGDATELVTIRTEDATLRKDGRIVGEKLRIVPLAPPELASAMRTLASAETLWLEIHGASLAHAGQDVKKALAAFQGQCLPATAAAPGDFDGHPR